MLFGQDWNDESWAICKSDMLIKGEDADNIVLGDTLHQGRLRPRRGRQEAHFDYMLANPPFGVEWKQQQKLHRAASTRRSATTAASAPGLPRINDGSLLFLQHMLSKMRAPKEGGSRIGIVFNGSPLFTGDAGSGESNIRQWIIENDWLEAIVALPDQLFYNTGISTYIWVVTNRKEPRRKGKVQLIDARRFFVKMREEPRQQAQQDRRPGDGRASPTRSATSRASSRSTWISTEKFSAWRPDWHRPMAALGVAKGLINQAAGMDRFDVHLDRELDHLTRIADGAEFAEGIESFFAKRPPRFQG